MRSKLTQDMATANEMSYLLVPSARRCPRRILANISRQFWLNVPFFAAKIRCGHRLAEGTPSLRLTLFNFDSFFLLIPPLSPPYSSCLFLL